MEFEVYRGEELKDLLPHIAKLRIEVFKEFPFLYEGTVEEEMPSLKKYFDMNDGLVVVATSDNKIVGLSTGYPLEYESGGG
ncbi:MAG: hypothetical protein P0S95_03925 [Rhabdochlamydiaceae bacterium]|nr:hypothetical protein [Candidatus Amphrikana amoebophyrae]